MFNIGDKVVCISLDKIQIHEFGYEHCIKELELYGTYTVSLHTPNDLFLDGIMRRSYNPDRFILFTEFRKMKIIKLIKL